jgi:hypothetical protein
MIFKFSAKVIKISEGGERGLCRENRFEPHSGKSMVVKRQPSVFEPLSGDIKYYYQIHPKQFCHRYEVLALLSHL